MNIELSPIDRPQPHPSDSRHNDNPVGNDNCSIAELAWAQPIVVHMAKVVIIGLAHT